MSPEEIAILIGLAGAVAGTIAVAGAGRPAPRPVRAKNEERDPRRTRR